MNLFWAAIFLPAGLLILLKGANWLVDGAVGLAESFNVSPLIIGLTIVAMGTSAPEVATSITAAAKNFGDTAIGNIYGSIIANLAFVGGLCAVIRPITVKLSVLRRELPIMLIVVLLLWPMLALDSYLGQIDGLLLLVLFIILLVFTIFTGLRDAKAKPCDVAEISEHIHDKDRRPQKSIFADSIFIILGLAGLALGAELALRGGVYIGVSLGLSQTVIGLTIIAVGTSLPELMTCVVAAFKGHDDISVGTLVGSNVFNALLAIGCVGLIRPFEINPRLIGVDYWIMVVISAAFVLTATIGKRISRTSGLLLLTAYIAYILYVLIFTRGI